MRNARLCCTFITVRCSTVVRQLPKLALAIAALVFFGTTLANSSVFTDVPAAAPTNDIAAPTEDPSQSFALTLAALACVGYLAGRRRRR